MLRAVLLIAMLPVLAYSYTTTINLNDDNCDIWNSNDVYTYSEYLVKWSGTKLTDSCQIKFNNEETDRRICVKATYYSVNNCGVTLKYYGGLLGDVFQNSYSCFDSPSEYCGDTYNDLSIKLKTPSSSSSFSSFTLKVYSKSSSNPVVIGVSVSASVIFAMCVLIVILIIVRRRIRAPQRTLLTSYPPPTTSIVTSNVSTGISNPNYPGYNQAPPPYSQTQYGQTPYNQVPYPGSTTATSTVVH